MSSTLEEDDDVNIDIDIEDEFKQINVEYDFDAWEAFRTSLPDEKRKNVRRSTATLQQSLQLMNVAAEEEQKEEAAASKQNDGAQQETSNEITATELTEEEQADIEEWRKRYIGCDGFVFHKNYIPKPWELTEMEEIIEFLALQDSDEHPEYMKEPGQITSKQAIKSIFFPKSYEPHSVLLKRGPVLVGGENEMELMLFTNGFLLSRVEMDTLVDLFVSGNEEGMQRNQSKQQLTERFLDIDSDQSGSISRDEIGKLFESKGMALSEETLDSMMKRFDRDSDGSIDIKEFKSMASWNSSWLGKTIRNRNVKLRRLDVAYRMSDIDRIENISVCQGGDFDSECGKLTFAIYLKYPKGVENPVERIPTNPLVMTCSKSGQVSAWMEAFCSYKISTLGSVYFR